MSPRHRYTFYLDDEQRNALSAIKQRDGISESEQIRRAIKDSVEKRGITATAKAERKRAPTRKRP